MDTKRRFFDYFPLAYKRMKKLLHVSDMIKENEWRRRHDALIEKILNSSASGTSKEPLCDEEVIVSLTTYGKRFLDVAVAIESIMQGTVKPNRIILWLGEDMKSLPIPVTLQKQMERGLEIEYCKDIRSFTKLVPCLRKYPEASIITIDDDLIYNYDLVENLVNMHKQYPQNIIASRIHQIILNSSGKPIKYSHWRWEAQTNEISPLNFLTGVGGVLYPPHSLDEEVLNEDVFLDICKFADDIWFYAMALKKGTRVRSGLTHSNKGEDYFLNEKVQDIGLCNTQNSKFIGKDMVNDIQFNAVFKKYDLYKKLIQ